MNSQESLRNMGLCGIVCVGVWERGEKEGGGGEEEREREREREIMHGHMCLITRHVIVRVWASLLCEYGQSF